MELGVLLLRVGARGWFNEFVTERTTHFGIRVHELAACFDQLSLDGGANLEHVARVTQGFVDVVYKSAPFDQSNQKVCVTSLRAGACNADSMRVVGQALVLLVCGRVSTCSRRIFWRSTQAQIHGQKKVKKKTGKTNAGSVRGRCAAAP